MQLCRDFTAVDQNILPDCIGFSAFALESSVTPLFGLLQPTGASLSSRAPGYAKRGSVRFVFVLYFACVSFCLL